MSPRPLRTIASVTSTFALVAAGIAATTSVAQAVDDVDSTTCPGTDVWTGGFTPGQPVHGLTTTHGIAPEAFTGTYVDTLKNGAGRDKDILVFKMAGSRITKTNSAGDVSVDAGIWAGMSGSPVYDADGNLIGSVSYGFSGAPSDYAGITPATDILAIDKPAAAATAVKSAAVPKAVAKSLAAASESAADTASDYSSIHQLALPRVSVGTPGKDATKMAAKSRTLAKKLPGQKVSFQTAAEATNIDPVAAIVPGGNIATAWSYGDVAMASVGTITAVCGTKVFAFGHPDDFSGSSTETFHAASAAFIQEDSANGSYKLANIDMDPVGQVTQDRLSGIMGDTTKLPTTTVVTSNTTVDGTTTSATTNVAVPAALGSAVGNQVFNDVIAGLDAYSAGGEALMTWTINYTPKGGSAATYTRTQRVSTNEAFAEQAPYDVASDVEFLQTGSDTKVTINSVTINTELKPDYNALRISQIDIRKNGAWVKVKNGTKVPARRGKAFPVQVHLVPANGDSTAAPEIKRLDQTISTSAYGTGIVSFVGGLNYYDDSEEFTIDIDEDDEEFYYGDEEPLTLAQVLAALKAQVRYDSARSAQQYTTRSGTDRISRKAVDTSAVTSGSAYIRLGYTK
ncbi:hypothetical protein [Aeromicrobium sp. 9AM]|uniref:hypothetical protein n=1 Tax=Aeromicrobium sp. 9AM TaxID=2653126 RepID=UPI0012F3A9CF|nr:hypothetical protein [Aeromicrobium sp. 9AM]VXC55183.1 conserved exported hypothetical protein [Aeromicrobium sp. 9AM]